MSKLARTAPREAGNRVYVEDLEAWEKQTGVKVSPGDALFVYNDGRNGGFDISVAPWMKARGVAVTSGVRAVATTTTPTIGSSWCHSARTCSTASNSRNSPTPPRA